jgi:hypothetical protein
LWYRYGWARRCQPTDCCVALREPTRAPRNLNLWVRYAASEQNSRHAIDTAQRLSHQLRAAEDRIAELEAQAEAYRHEAERAEQWLNRVYTEIEERFLRRPDDRRGTPQRSQSLKTERT